MKQLRIAWICNSKVTFSETFLMDNIEILKGLGEVHCFTGTPCDANLPNLSSGTFDVLPMNAGHSVVSRLLRFNYRNARKQKMFENQCLKKLRAISPDLLWFEFATTAFNAWKVLSHLNIPYIVNIHGFDVSSAFHDLEYARAFRQITSNATAVICASRFIKNKCIAHGTPREKCHIVNLVVNSPKTAIDINEKTDFPSFIQISRLEEVKGTHITLRAFEQIVSIHPKARFTIIGDGSEASNLKKLVAELKIGESVRFCGSMSRSDAHQIMRKHWIGVQHSISDRNGAQEGFGLSLAEFSAAGLPVITTHHGGIPEHIIDKSSGILSNEYDIEHMTASMLQLIGDDALRFKLGEYGTERYAKNNSQEQRDSQIKSILHSLIG